MPSVNWRQIAWQSSILHVLYVWVVGLAAVFVISVLRLESSDLFARVPVLITALATIWAAHRVALRAGKQPMVHGLLVGFLVGLIGLILAFTTTGLSAFDFFVFLLYGVGGFLGGRMAQRMLQSGGSDR